ncbi:hypothetical protein [Mesorhizobium humile]|jgi:hypothetical protein|uniref:Uncharacterized protein n=1 Tax=Mesorhizobium humile TaxID=3072313 RepID=A0ABU4YEN3_9HYPH|nr:MULTISPECIES: hypothetical protein [unclassified Mesorhizobium]MDX8460538.1 hypothetical protein [Mesorhizobium sp. VK2D]MDX8485373.1 hypothetical protein [Mesorhizobium sp. VK2B]
MHLWALNDSCRLTRPQAVGRTLLGAGLMPSLVLFVIKNIAIGAIIGLIVACWLVAFGTVGSHISSGNGGYVAVGMIAYSMASSFGMGFLATALMFLE